MVVPALANPVLCASHRCSSGTIGGHLNCLMRELRAADALGPGCVAERANLRLCEANWGGGLLLARRQCGVFGIRIDLRQ